MTGTALPDVRGHFGGFGGRYVPETLMTALDELLTVYETARKDPAFEDEFRYYLKDYVGRPSPLYYAERLTETLGGARIYLKREDLNHTGAHKINNTIGQALLTLRMKKPRIIAETGAGQHGVASATVAARFGLECDVYMGTEDMDRQALNVFRMRLMGSRVIGVSAGSRTLKDALNEALRDWATHVRHTHYIIGSVAGPHPFPMMVRDFQSVIGRKLESRSWRKRAGCRMCSSPAWGAAATPSDFSTPSSTTTSGWSAWKARDTDSIPVCTQRPSAWVHRVCSTGP